MKATFEEKQCSNRDNHDPHIYKIPLPVWAPPYYCAGVIESVPTFYCHHLMHTDRCSDCKALGIEVEAADIARAKETVKGSDRMLQNMAALCYAMDRRLNEVIQASKASVHWATAEVIAKLETEKETLKLKIASLENDTYKPGYVSRSNWNAAQEELALLRSRIEHLKTADVIQSNEICILRETNHKLQDRFDAETRQVTALNNELNGCYRKMRAVEALVNKPLREY